MTSEATRTGSTPTAPATSAEQMTLTYEDRGTVDQTSRSSTPPEAARPAIETPGGRFEFAAHNCFACGTLNAGGLGLVLHIEPGRSWTEVTLDRRFEGWEGVIHGGILCSILDEVMAWALVGEDNWGVTARMAVDFRRPVAVGVRVRAEGWINRSRRRIVDTEGTIVDAETGAELATATGVYLAADGARKQDLRERYAFRVAERGNPDNQPDAVATRRPEEPATASDDPR